MNIGWIESEKDFYFYPEGVSPSVVRVMEKLEAERLALGKAIGVELSSSLELLHRFYSVQENTLYEAINKNKAYQAGKAPTTLKYRCIWRYSYGLVPISELGTALEVPTPCTDLLIDLAEMVVSEDLRGMGIKLERFGVKDMTKGEIIELLTMTYG